MTREPDPPRRPPAQIGMVLANASHRGALGSLVDARGGSRCWDVQAVAVPLLELALRCMDPQGAAR